MINKTIDNLHLIFIVGCQRSGTTLLGQILGAHPKAILIDEKNGVYDLIDTIITNSSKWKRNKAYLRSLLSARNHYRFKNRFGVLGLPDKSVTHLVFKAPNTTYDFERLREMYSPKMHFVFITRDVRDVVCSMQKLSDIPIVENQLRFIENSDSVKKRFINEFQLIHKNNVADHIRKAHVWNIKTSLYNEFIHPPLTALKIRYEDLVSNPNQSILSLLDHVELEANFETTRHHETVLKGFGPGSTDRTREIDSSSAYKWKQNLDAQEEKDIWSVAGLLMKELGYSRNYPEKREPNQISSQILSSPIIATGRGGSGTRLLSLLLQEHEVFLGNRLNRSEDSVEWTNLIYQLATEKLLENSSFDSKNELSKFISLAKYILSEGHWNPSHDWGLKLPESMLVLEELLHFFTRARIIHLVRHPVSSCLRNSHLTSNMDNKIGSATLTRAYKWLEWNRDPQNDSDYMCNAASWIFQVEQAKKIGDQLGPKRYLEIKYEEICANPQIVSDKIALFLDKPVKKSLLEKVIDHSRQQSWSSEDERAHQVWKICEPTAVKLGYGFPA